MKKFKIGDEVKLKEYGPFSDYRGHKGETAIIINDQGIIFDFEIRWKDKSISCVDENNLERSTPMSQYNDLKQRIEALNDGWNKEADDLVTEILKSYEPLYGVGITSYGGCQERQRGDIRITRNDMRTEIFTFTSQCSKMTAFKQALLWLLDHSEIKKSDNSEKIAELQQQLDEMKNEHEKSMQRLKDQIEELK